MFYQQSLAMDVESEIARIRERNARVEADKAWETSLTRRAIIALGTYLAAFLLFLVIEAPNPQSAALVPALAFLLSTLTLPFFKDLWLKRKE